MRCRKQKGKGDRHWCAQPAADDGRRCAFHAMITGLEESGVPVNVDRYYAEKVFDGVIRPTWTEISKVEARALLFGRAHHDGRRLDDWVMPENR